MKYDRGKQHYCGTCGKGVSMYSTFYVPIVQKTDKEHRHWVACSYDHAKQIEIRYPIKKGGK
jgi:hypothetical protein